VTPQDSEFDPCEDLAPIRNKKRGYLASSLLLVTLRLVVATQWSGAI
jgi:hypothetical protein